jgi:hypothetical protein
MELHSLLTGFVGSGAAAGLSSWTDEAHLKEDSWDLNAD